jgi:hypothetical protein
VKSGSMSPPAVFFFKIVFGSVGPYISQLSCHCERMPDINNLREEIFILLTVSEGSGHSCLLHVLGQ